MYLSFSTNSQLGASLTPSRVELFKSDSADNLNKFIVQSLPTLCPCSNHTFGCNLYLKHHLGDENSFLNKIITYVYY